jgi:hypothetical protein
MKRSAAVLWAIVLGLLAPGRGAEVVNPAQRSPSVALERVSRPDIEASLMKCPPKNSDRFQLIEQMFRDAGCPDGQMSTQRVKGSKEPNLICTFPGQTEKAIIVGAHFDCGPEGLGLIDNWSGVALLPALYKTLSKHPRHHRFVFIAFAAEEKGLLGSKTYAKKMAPDEVSRIAAMVNLDCLGLGSTAVWVERSDKLLWESLNRAAAVTELPLRGVNLPLGFVGFDSDSFAERGIPVLVVHSAAQETWLLPHTTSDGLGSMNLEEYFRSYGLVSVFLAYLDIKLK